MLLVAIFIVGYLAIVFEHSLKLNKAASALLMGVLCWTAYVASADGATVNEQLLHHFADIAQIVFFLLGAMTIVELIDAHDGFDLITSRIHTTNRRKLLVIIAVFAFLLSAVLDNLTTSIVMMSLVRKLTADPTDRKYFGGMVIIAANSGGVWSPIGDVTTTMLWVGGQVTTTGLVVHLVVPAFASIAVPLVWIGLRLRGSVTRARRELAVEKTTDATGATRVVLPAEAAALGKNLAELNLRARTGVAVATITRAGSTAAPKVREPLQRGDELALVGDDDAIERAVAWLVNGRSPDATSRGERNLVFAVGVGVLLGVPVFKTLTSLPPVMGILLGLGVLWAVTEFIHKKKNDEAKSTLSVAGALQRVDSQSVLFFLGILLAIGALESTGALRSLAGELDTAIGNVDAITISIGLSSSVIDNVPLVAAAQGMYTLARFPIDHHFWLFLAYCAGTGGSILIIGSAAGIAVMGIERITFGWYVRHMSLPAVFGYAAGALAYLALNAM